MYLDKYVSRFLLPQIARPAQASFSIMTAWCFLHSSFALLLMIHSAYREFLLTATPANTDGIINKLVTGFALLHLDNFVITIAP